MSIGPPQRNSADAANPAPPPLPGWQQGYASQPGYAAPPGYGTASGHGAHPRYGWGTASPPYPLITHRPANLLKFVFGPVLAVGLTMTTILMFVRRPAWDRFTRR